MSWTKGQLLWVRTGREPGGVILVLRKRLGKAFLRNRLKRRLRHVCRELNLPATESLVVLAQQQAASCSFQRLRVEMTQLLAGLGQSKVLH
ncbi:MAG: ribonuclease P protein component [bacterium]|nr:ribonuclease P protein component [bacterium]